MPFHSAHGSLNSTAARGRYRRPSSLAGLLALALVGLMLPSAAAAQDFPADAQVERSAETGKVRFVGMAPGRPDAAPAGLQRQLIAGGGRTGLPRAPRRGARPRRALGGRGRELHARRQGHRQRALPAEAQGRRGARRAVRRALRQRAQHQLPQRRGRPGRGRLRRVARDRLRPRRSARRSPTSRRTRRCAPPRCAPATTSLRVFDSRILGGPGADRPTLVYQTLVTSTPQRRAAPARLRRRPARHRGRDDRRDARGQEPLGLRRRQLPRRAVPLHVPGGDGRRDASAVPLRREARLRLQRCDV